MKLNAAQIKAMESGADLAAIMALATTPEDATITATAAVVVPTTTAPAVVVPATTPVDATVTTPAVTTPVDAATVPTVLASVHEGVVSALNAQMAAVNASLASAQAEVQSLKAASANVEGLTSIVRGILSNKIVALGGAAETADTFNASNIVAEYARIDEQFKTKFKAGGVAATASPVPVETTPQKANPVDAAIMQFTIQS